MGSKQKTGEWALSEISFYVKNLRKTQDHHSLKSKLNQKYGPNKKLDNERYQELRAEHLARKPMSHINLIHLKTLKQKNTTGESRKIHT